MKNKILQKINNILDLIPSRLSPIVAGGAIRDIILSKEVKDIDIYVQMSEASLQHDLEYWKQTLQLNDNDTIEWTLTCDSGPDPIKSEENHDPIDQSSNEFMKLRKVEHGLEILEGSKDNVPFNIMLLSCSPESYVLDYFDINLCRIYYDGDNIHASKEFLEDVANKTITLDGKHLTIDRIERSIENHIPRIQKKYPDYEVKYSDKVQSTLDAMEGEAV